MLSSGDTRNVLTDMLSEIITFLHKVFISSLNVPYCIYEITWFSSICFLCLFLTWLHQINFLILNSPLYLSPIPSPYWRIPAWLYQPHKRRLHTLHCLCLRMQSNTDIYSTCMFWSPMISQVCRGSWMRIRNQITSASLVSLLFSDSTAAYLYIIMIHSYWGNVVLQILPLSIIWAPGLLMKWK